MYDINIPEERALDEQLHSSVKEEEVAEEEKGKEGGRTSSALQTHPFFLLQQFVDDPKPTQLGMA